MAGYSLPLWAITIVSSCMRPLQLAEQHERRWLLMQSQQLSQMCTRTASRMLTIPR